MNPYDTTPDGWIDFPDWVRATQAWLEAQMPKVLTGDEAAYLAFRRKLLEPVE